ncbi:lysosomal-associated transmembrane protein 4B [Tribolium castaneum]|uniref:Lysosomal-associated transmembrane protein 4B-like Protein n=1 Tax=Tribolium castaneum TaxID=7070 RepID=D6WYF0_TRICA|nr:PREDICTED: lysosomal-associated transmembrane protein 4B [Tribolium castaneum]EFA08970.2 Lysosomal-associated transmembrane protein 4B-like Protein [Tribolium castaneum]|eukprot:XP_972854.2 PREDICTED: lysosomal-associated transmembrane protein 4B [Tribolium castaneum]
MFPKRFKLGSARNNEWRCCFCLHVRTATILLGIWHLILHILALAVLALLMRNHNVIMQHNAEFEQSNFLPTPLSKKVKDEDNPYYLPTTQDGRTIYSSDIDMGALMTVCTLSITLLMVYGTIRGKATHLLPFFCLQLFDFAITTLTATGYFCYLRSVHRLVAEHWHNLPFRNELLKLSPQYLSLLVLAAFLISMLWKAYCIGIVWRCYKYLTLRQQSRNNTIHYILPTEGSDRLPEPDYSTLLREQEAAFGGALKMTPPPSYQDIMEDQPPPYPTVLVNEVHSPGTYRVETEAQQPQEAAAEASNEGREGEKKEEEEGNNSK